MKKTSDLCDRIRLARVIVAVLIVMVATDVVVGGNIEVVRSGVAVSKWDNSVVAGNAANSDWSEDGGMEIDPSWITSGTKATYKFLIPETTLPGGVTNLQVRIYGRGKNGTLEPSLYAGPENNRVELDSSLPEAEGETIAYSIPLSCLVEAEGSIPGNWLDITLDFGYIDWYDVKYVKVEYSVSGVEQESLECYQSILNASQTLWIFYDEVAKNWPHPVASTDGMEAIFMAVIPGYKSVFAAGNPLASAILEILKLPKLYQDMKSTFEEFFAFTDFMQDCTVFFTIYSGNEASVAFNGMANLANVWKNAISDNGRIDSDEISDIDSSISDAIQKNNSLTNIICGEWSIGQNLKNILNNNADQGVRNCAKAGLVLLSPMIRFNPETGIEQSGSYLPALNETLDSMRPVQLGSLMVTLNPFSGQWHLSGNSLDFGLQASGATVNNIPPNTYTLEFSSVSGYITPTPRTITIGGGANTQTVNYQQSGGETITLSAAEYANIYSDFPTSRNLYANFMSIYYNGIPDQYWAILLKFNLSGIPAGSTVNSARLELYCQMDTGNNNIGILKCTSNWSQNNVCWDNMPTRGGGSFSSNSSGVGTWIWANSLLDQHVQNWINNPGTNYGVFLGANIYGRADFSNGSSQVPSANRPKLIVTYTPPQTKTISGYIRDSGSNGISGVTVSANNSGGSATTESSGYYNISVPYNWDGHVTPAKANYDFSPPYTNYSSITNNQADQNYIGTLQFRTISGYVRTSGSSGISGITVSADNSGDSTTTEPSGYYSITVPYDWSGRVGTVFSLEYLIKLYTNGGSISPSYMDYTNVISNHENQNYIVFLGAVAAPTFSPSGGIFEEPVNVSISCSTAEATIRYTTDGTNPTESSPIYSNPISVNSDMTLKAKAWKTDWTPSQTITSVYDRITSPDINGDENVNLVDYSRLASRWLDTDCSSSNSWCNFADINRSGTVDNGDLDIIAEHWLEDVLNPDINNDGQVDFKDFSLLGSEWLAGDCDKSGWCNKADIDHSGNVDIYDLTVIAEHWLERSQFRKICIDFDYLPDGAPTVNGNIIADDYADWGIHFGSLGVSDSPKYQSFSATTRAADASHCSYPPGFNIILNSDVPIYEISVNVTSAANEIVRMVVKDKSGQETTLLSDPIPAAYDLSEQIYWKSDVPIYRIEWWPPNQATGIIIDDLSLLIDTTTIYQDDFRESLTWMVSDSSVYIKDNEYLYISADGGLTDDDGAEKIFDIDLMPGKQIIIEQRVKLESGGLNYRLPHTQVYFEDMSDIGVTYLPSGPGQSYGWLFADWTGINQPEIPGAGDWNSATADYWTVIRLVITPTGGELYMKPDDAGKGWFSDNFSFIAFANWSHSKISKIKFTQPWDSVNYMDYITIKSQ
ncbi:MAG: chitobiase/beta-hexosaminidase C-terminal domain-containing protein [Phycisphaerae bacterium]